MSTFYQKKKSISSTLSELILLQGFSISDGRSMRINYSWKPDFLPIQESLFEIVSLVSKKYANHVIQTLISGLNFFTLFLKRVFASLRHFCPTLAKCLASRATTLKYSLVLGVIDNSMRICQRTITITTTITNFTIASVTITTVPTTTIVIHSGTTNSRIFLLLTSLARLTR